MKKFISMFSVVMAMASVSFVSCSNDDDVIKTIDPQENPQSTRAFSSVKAKYSFELTDATLNVANVVVSYTNEEGKTVNETVSDRKWEKTVNINKPVSECGFQLSFTKLADSDETICLGLDRIGISIDSYDQNGKLLSMYKRATESASTLKPENLDKFFAQYADTPYFEMAATFSKKGEGSDK